MLLAQCIDVAAYACFERHWWSVADFCLGCGHFVVHDSDASDEIGQRRLPSRQKFLFTIKVIRMLRREMQPQRVPETYWLLQIGLGTEGPAAVFQV